MTYQLANARVWDGNQWVAAIDPTPPFVFVPVTATGGTETTVVVGGIDYRVHTFTTSGNFVVSDAGTDGLVEFLIVAGGGGGGSRGVASGGGGAGGVATGWVKVTATTIAVTVGAGGAGGPTSGTFPGTPGSDSSFGTLAGAFGGGGGGPSGLNGNTFPQIIGASAGGLGSTTASVTNIVRWFDAQGRAGGNAYGDATLENRGGGGGGGAGGTGGNGALVTGGNGGLGVTIWGLSVAGGGGGSAATPGTATDGGGAGASTTNGASATANTGGGGGGAGGGGTFGVVRAGGNGGSGIVVLRYPLELA